MPPKRFGKPIPKLKAYNGKCIYCAKCVHNIQAGRKKSISVFHVKISHVYNNDACTYKGLRKGYSKLSPLLVSVRSGQPGK